MATINLDLAGFTATHTISAGDQTKLLAALKDEMSSMGDWPDDGQGGKTEPTNAQVAQWVVDVWIPRKFKLAEQAYQERLAAADYRAAREAITPIVFS